MKAILESKGHSFPPSFGKFKPSTQQTTRCYAHPPSSSRATRLDGKRQLWWDSRAALVSNVFICARLDNRRIMSEVVPHFCFRTRPHFERDCERICMDAEGLASRRQWYGRPVGAAESASSSNSAQELTSFKASRYRAKGISPVRKNLPCLARSTLGVKSSGISTREIASSEPRNGRDSISSSSVRWGFCLVSAVASFARESSSAAGDAGLFASWRGKTSPAATCFRILGRFVRASAIPI